MKPLESFIEGIASHLGQIEGIVAVALGGSWARGEAGPDSDIDLGIYYEPDHPPSVTALRQLARELDDRHLADPVTDFGEWGPWINGGAWLQIEGQRVDWLYRDLGRVRQVIEDCRAGRIICDYQPGHPHGFHNYIYMGEIFYAKPLCDPERLEGAESAHRALSPEAQAGHHREAPLGSRVRARNGPKVRRAGRCVLRYRRGSSALRPPLCRLCLGDDCSVL